MILSSKLSKPNLNRSVVEIMKNKDETKKESRNVNILENLKNLRR